MDDEADHQRRLIETLDGNRFREIMVKSVLAANLWLAINLAAQRADASDIRQKIHLLTQLAKSTGPLVKALGSEDVTDG